MIQPLVVRGLLLSALLLTQGGSGGTAGEIAGRLLKVDGSPASSVRVAAITISNQPTEDAAILALASTDSLGRYRLTDVPPGRYHIVAGSFDALTYYPGAPFVTGAAAVTLTKGASLDGVDFPLTVAPKLQVSGRIVDNSGQTLSPSPIARVTLSGNGLTLTANVRSDGAFAFPDVRPGVYRSSILDAAATNLPPRLNTSEGSEISGPIVVVDQDVSGLEVRLFVVHVKGRVSNPAVSEVLFLPKESGRATLRADVRGGSFELAVMPGAFVASVTRSPAPVFPAPEFNVTIAATDSVQVELHPPLERSILIRSSVEGGGAPPSFLLRFEGKSQAGPASPLLNPQALQARSMEATVAGFEAEIKPGPDGTFRISMPEGAYRFGVGWPDGVSTPTTVKSMEVVGENPLRKLKAGVELTVDSDGHEIRVVFEPPARR